MRRRFGRAARFAIVGARHVGIVPHTARFVALVPREIRATLVDQAARARTFEQIGQHHLFALAVAWIALERRALVAVFVAAAHHGLVRVFAAILQVVAEGRRTEIRAAALDVVVATAFHRFREPARAGARRVAHVDAGDVDTRRARMETMVGAIRFAARPVACESTQPNVRHALVHRARIVVVAPHDRPSFTATRRRVAYAFFALVHVRLLAVVVHQTLDARGILTRRVDAEKLAAIHVAPRFVLLDARAVRQAARARTRGVVEQHLLAVICVGVALEHAAQIRRRFVDAHAFHRVRARANAVSVVPHKIIAERIGAVLGECGARLIVGATQPGFGNVHAQAAAIWQRVVRHAQCLLARLGEFSAVVFGVRAAIVSCARHAREIPQRRIVRIEIVVTRVGAGVCRARFVRRAADVDARHIHAHAVPTIAHVAETAVVLWIRAVFGFGAVRRRRRRPKRRLSRWLRRRLDRRLG